MEPRGARGPFDEEPRDRATERRTRTIAVHASPCGGESHGAFADRGLGRVILGWGLEWIQWDVIEDGMSVGPLEVRGSSEVLEPRIVCVSRARKAGVADGAWERCSAKHPVRTTYSY